MIYQVKGIRGCVQVCRCAGVPRVSRCAWVCTGVCGCAWVCAGVRRCAQVCAGVHMCAQECTCVRRCAHVCAVYIHVRGWVCAVCASVKWCVWKSAEVYECLRVCVLDEFSEYLLETRVNTSADLVKWTFY